MDFRKKFFLSVKVFDSFERNNNIDRLRSKRNRLRASLQEMQVFSAVICSGVFDGFRVDFDSGHRSRSLRKQGAPVALPRGDIQHIQSPYQISGKKISMEMLDFDLTFSPGRHSFTSPLKRPDWFSFIK